ncbi:TOM1-like protein 6 isoform X2 [Vigna unguiculata]|nr:TOM1-like protein 6 isoform X2 [Vigna unguiculata]
MQVRDKILILLDSWQEAFGGPGGKHPQYYRACKELKQSGVVFPKRVPDAAAIYFPPSSHPSSRNMAAGYWMAGNSSKTLDETMATEIESLSMSSLDSMRYVLDLLSDMLQAVNPNDRAAVKDEVIVDLVDRCRTNQKKLMQMLTTTGDEELLGKGLELNDSIQSLLARHDAIASGTPFPIQGESSNTVPNEAQCTVDQSNINSSSPGESSSTPKATTPAIVISETRSQTDDEEDEFAQLLPRPSKAQPTTSKDATTVPNPSTSVPSNALVLSDPPTSVSTENDQDIIDLLSITLSISPSPETTYSPSASSQAMHQIPVQSRTEGFSHASQTYLENLSYNSYVVPWAQNQSKSEFETLPQQQTFQSQSQTPSPPSSRPTYYEVQQQEQLQPQTLPQSQHVFQQPQHHQYSPHQQHLQSPSEPQPLQYQPQTVNGHQPQPQQQFQNQHLQYPSRYPLPQWAPTPGYANYQNHSPATNVISTQANTTASYSSAPGVRPVLHNNSFGGTPASATGQKLFVPSYRLFEDLNVLGNTNGKVKMGPGMVGGRR